MYLEWLLNPLTIYSASAVCLLTSLAMVVRSRIRTPQSNDPAPVVEIPNTEIVILKAEVEQLRQSVCRLEESMPARGTGVGLNVTKRTVALRMHHRGEPVASIATALETPANEIALLIKLSAFIQCAGARARPR